MSFSENTKQTRDCMRKNGSFHDIMSISDCSEWTLVYDEGRNSLRLGQFTRWTHVTPSPRGRVCSYLLISTASCHRVCLIWHHLIAINLLRFFKGTFSWNLAKHVFLYDAFQNDFVHITFIRCLWIWRYYESCWPSGSLCDLPVEIPDVIVHKHVW